MKKLVQDPESYFAFFYVLAFAVTTLLFIISSLRQKIPLYSVLLMLTAVSFCTIIGSRLSAVPFQEWGKFLSGGFSGTYNGRHALGGLLAGLAGLAISVKVLGLDKKTLALSAWITPLGFGIQKAGCLLNGCCYGKVTEFPWGIQFSVGTPAHFNHFSGGLIAADSDLSLAVHPVQLYEMLLLFLISFIVWRIQNKWTGKWSAVLSGLLLACVARFILGFLRDPAASDIRIMLAPGLSLVQVLLLIMALVSGVILFISERRPYRYQNMRPAVTPLNNFMVFILALASMIYIFRGLFSSFELISLNIRFIPAIILTVFIVVRSLASARSRLAATTLLAAPLFLAYQTLMPDNTKSDTSRNLNGPVKSYKRIDLNMSAGELYSNVMFNPHEGQCGTVYTDEDYRHVYRMAGAGFSFIREDRKAISTGGIILYGGTNHESNLTKQWETKDFLFGINPFYLHDLKWVGIGFGAHIGNIRWVPGSPISELVYDRGTKYSPLMPEFVFRIGRKDIVDFQYSYGYDLPAPIPVMLHQISIGTGFGSRTDYSLRTGAALSENYSTAFISAEALLGRNLGLAFKYNFGGDDFYFGYPSTDFIEQKGRIQFGASYRFGFKN